MMTSIGVLIAVAGMLLPAAGEPRTPLGSGTGGINAPRVRPYDARAKALLTAGLERSATFRRIVDQLDGHDVIVYIEMKPGLAKHFVGTLNLLAATKSHRYLHIAVNPLFGQQTQIAALGHELRHALEVAHAPAIVDAASFEAHYRQHGVNVKAHANGWDTQAAKDAGEDVRRELADRRAAIG